MSVSRRGVIGLGLGLMVMFSGIFVFLYLSSSPDKLEIGFVPKYINSAPGEMGWFLVDINTTMQIVPSDISISTNMSVETDSTFWESSPLLEVFIYPNSSHIDSWIEISVSITSGNLTVFDTAYLLVHNWTATSLSYALHLREVFIEYLSVNHPSFSIDNTTDWTPIYNGVGILVVDHYLFRSAQWELAISWHVMIAPHDWVQVYLRNRADVRPSWAGKIDSWSTDNQTIVVTDPPTEIYRSAWAP